eukprot:c18075_g1_i6.p1 GENE.c18075_g1_i6~~c18075_g1_i6.p1  ORF type:complete len:139 (-),score=13.97 c18075_g1_i6:29-445(-)
MDSMSCLNFRIAASSSAFGLVSGTVWSLISILCCSGWGTMYPLNKTDGLLSSCLCKNLCAGSWGEMQALTIEEGCQLCDPVTKLDLVHHTTWIWTSLSMTNVPAFGSMVSGLYSTFCFPSGTMNSSNRFGSFIGSCPE